MAKRTGRPTDLTPEVQEGICRAVRAGNFPSAAAQSMGVGRRTFFTWMKKGKAAPDGPYGHFRREVQRAERESEVALVAIWREHTAKNWQAAAALLERRFPRRWLRPQHVQVAATMKIEDARDLLLARLDKLAAQQVEPALIAAPDLVAPPSPPFATLSPGVARVLDERS